MHQGFQVAREPWDRENTLAQRAAVQLPVGGQQSMSPKRSTRRSSSGCPGCHHIARDLIGIDDRHAEAANRPLTVDLPLAMPPVSPTR